MTAPKQMQAGATEKVFVTFHDIDFDVEMKLVLKKEHEPGEYGTWSFSFRAGTVVSSVFTYKLKVVEQI